MAYLLAVSIVEVLINLDEDWSCIGVGLQMFRIIALYRIGYLVSLFKIIMDVKNERLCPSNHLEHVRMSFGVCSA